MFGIGMPEMLMILAIALIVIGPKKLPDLAKMLGRAMGEFKKATSEIKESMEANSDFMEVKDSLDELKSDIRESISFDNIDSYQPQNETSSEGTISPSSEYTASQAEDTEETMDKLKDAFDEIDTTDHEKAAEEEARTDADDIDPENDLEEPQEDERG